MLTRDITERKRTEEAFRRTQAESDAIEALRASEERFRLLVEQVKDYAIFMLDPEGHITTWNAGAQRFKGYTAEEIIGQHFSRFYTPEDIARTCYELISLKQAAKRPILPLQAQNGAC